MSKKILFFIAFIFSCGLFSYASASDAVMCTMEAKLCPDGVNYVGRTGPNCEFAQCPSTTTPKACTREYLPVCGQPPMPTCSEGMACIMMMPAPKTYANKCLMKADNATLISEGECESATPYPSITVTTQNKLSAKIEELLAKVESKFSSNTSKISVINKMLVILYKKMETYKNTEVIQFIIDKLTDYKYSSLGATN